MDDGVVDSHDAAAADADDDACRGNNSKCATPTAGQTRGRVS